MDKLLEASEAAAKGDWRKAADSYWKAYQLASKEWAYNAISGYTSVLLEGHFKAAPTDLDRLRDLSKDIGAPPLLRSRVCFTRGYLLWLASSREKAKAQYRLAVKIADEASSLDLAAQIMFTTHSGLQKIPVGPLLRKVRQTAAVNLACLEGASPNQQEVNDNVSSGFPPNQ